MCTDVRRSLFVFDTTNQPNWLAKKIMVVERYTSVIFMLNPNTICFKNDTGCMCLNNVKFIRYHNDSQNVGRVFSVVCEGLSGEDEIYVFILDEI